MFSYFKIMFDYYCGTRVPTVNRQSSNGSF